MDFYRGVLGWEFSDPDPEFGGYAMARVNGADVAGLGPQPAPDVPVAWTLYLASDDVDATVAAVTEAGGSLAMEPDDVGGMGRMAVAIDPAAAAFGIWQAGQHLGAGRVNEPGALTWEDLRSTDAERARAFYAQVFGYRYENVDGAPDDYSMFSLPGGEGLGGIGGMMGQDDLSSHWLVYFGVADVDATVTTAESAGGSALAPAFDTSYGRMAALADPQGAVFWVVATPA
jgi:hypothetical protein